MNGKIVRLLDGLTLLLTIPDVNRRRVLELSDSPDAEDERRIHAGSDLFQKVLMRATG